MINNFTKKNIKRLVSKTIEEFIKSLGAIIISGPKWCGKTYLGALYSNSQCLIQSDLERYKELINQNFEENPIFIGEKPRLIDEWQNIPSIWDKARIYIDLCKYPFGQFILTGSTRVEKGKILHSGAGRFGNIKMSTLTFYEILQEEDMEFISIYQLFEDSKNNFKNLITKFSIEWIGKTMIKGGWPSIYSYKDNYKNSNVANQYVESIENLNEHIESKPRKSILKKFLNSISRLNGFQINNSTIIEDLNEEINKNTVPKYFDFVESIYLIDYLESWSLNVRSKTKIRTKPKMYLCDPSIGLSILGIDSYEKLINDTRLFGIYFENQVIKDLMVFAQNIGGQIFFYRNEKGFEIDCILQLQNGKWAPIEIKLTNSNRDAIEKSAKNLLTLENKIQTEYGLESKPSFYMIITTGEYSYRREDGVLVIPFTLLKP